MWPLVLKRAQQIQAGLIWAVRFVTGDSRRHQRSLNLSACSCFFSTPFLFPRRVLHLHRPLTPLWIFVSQTPFGLHSWNRFIFTHSYSDLYASGITVGLIDQYCLEKIYMLSMKSQCHNCLSKKKKKRKRREQDSCLIVDVLTRLGGKRPVFR